MIAHPQYRPCSAICVTIAATTITPLLPERTPREKLQPSIDTALAFLLLIYFCT